MSEKIEFQASMVQDLRKVAVLLLTELLASGFYPSSQMQSWESWNLSELAYDIAEHGISLTVSTILSAGSGEEEGNEEILLGKLNAFASLTHKSDAALEEFIQTVIQIRNLVPWGEKPEQYTPKPWETYEEVQQTLKERR